MRWGCAQTAAVFATFVALTEVSFAATSDRNEIYEKVLGGQLDSFIRPVVDDSQATQVTMRMTLQQIRDFDEKNQKLIVNVWINLYWHDDFFTWDPNLFGNVSSVYVPSSKIWRPDIALYNSIDTERLSTELLSDTTAIVTSTGDVTWSMPLIIKSACRVDIADYPFDIQHCPLKFGSWTYNGLELNLTNFADSAILDNYESNGEWTLLGVPCERHEVFYRCCPQPYPDVTFTVVMKRRPMFYLFNLLFPCVLLTVIGLMTFCLPPESGEKVSLAVTVLLAMTVFMLVIMENIPPTSEVVPLFGQFIGVTIMVLALITIANISVMNAHFRGLRGLRPSGWVRKLFLEWLSRVVCMHKVAYGSFNVDSVEISTSDRPPDPLSQPPIIRNGTKNSSVPFACSPSTHLAKPSPIHNRSGTHNDSRVDTPTTHQTYPERDFARNGSAPNFTSRTTASVASYDNVPHLQSTKAWMTCNDHSECKASFVDSLETGMGSSQNDNISTKMFRAVSSAAILETTFSNPTGELANKRQITPQTTRNENSVDTTDLAMREWQMVAAVMDRFMFLIFTVVVLIAYTAIFSRIPA